LIKALAISLFGFLGLNSLLAQAPDLLMQNGRVRMCEAVVKDSEAGLTVGDYGHNENMTMTICVPGAKKITLKFNSFCTEKDEDILSIFDGPDTNSTLLGRWSGTNGPGTIVSKDSCITLHFKSDKSVSCTGWEADLTTEIIVPTTPRLYLVGTVACNDNSVRLRSDVLINCDSFLASNATLTGPKSLGISSITPTNCVNGFTKTFTVNFSNAVNLNGRYTFRFTTNWKDFCGKVYTRNSSRWFDVLTCPLKVILSLDDTLICRGSCARLTAAVSGGDPSKYIYTWTPNAIKGAGPHTVCPTSKTTYILRVTDGISIPSADTITIDVLTPPTAQRDTTICYKSGNFFLRGSPAGGTWGGTGIVDAATGEYDPLRFTGRRKAWYQIGQCADTVLVYSRNAWQLPNVFCQGTTGANLWWTGPAGGTFSGLRTTSAGFFDPDTAVGIYKIQYDWNGCVITKNVEIVPKIDVPLYDTACESSSYEVLTFSPKGVYISWFPGLIDSYWGRYNPSAMGGPQTRLITWNAGGCKDSTYLTVLSIDAGPIDTFCPNQGMQTLTGFTPTVAYNWSKGKGIVNPTGDQYDPSFSTANYAIDTLEISSSKCKDETYIYLIKTAVSRIDTLKVCFEDPAVLLTPSLTKLYPEGGFWTGNGISTGNTFTAANAGYGYHPLIYHMNNCTDTFYAFVRPKPIVQADTQMCIDAPQFRCYKQESGGNFSGRGIVNGSQGIFRPSAAGAGTHTITYTSSSGCQAQFNVRVDAKPNVSFTNTPSEYCFKTQAFPLEANRTGGTFSGTAVSGTTFSPHLAGSGMHTLYYEFIEKTCTSYASLDVTVKDTLQLFVDPKSKEICPGELIWLKSQVKGGDPTNYLITWSNGKTGQGTFVSPLFSQTYSGTLTDGCSDQIKVDIPVKVNPRPYFNVQTAQPVCFGQQGWAKAYFPDISQLDLEWNTFPKTIGDSIYQNAGNTYRLNATYKSTGCASDTNITIPGYKAIDAGFTTYIPNGLPCISNIQPEMRVFDGSTGGTKGTWDWGDGNTQAYVPGLNPKHSYDGAESNYVIKLIIENAGGCIDSSFGSICYRDTILIFAPTGFSPNGDGKNETFSISAIGPNEIDILIYNRWGQMVYRSQDMNFAWDGKHLGRNCQEGVYTYQLRYKTAKSGLKQQAGIVYIMY